MGKSSDVQGLKDIFKGDFLIGVAMKTGFVMEGMPEVQPILEQHFNSLSPENGLKWVKVHPEQDRYDFEFGDKYVAMGEKLGAFTIGHCLVWHQQVPDWVFRDEAGEFLNKEALIERMEEHIEMVVGRYKGKIKGWDVVNEVFDDDGTWRKSSWYKIAGSDFIKAAFRKAHEIDPEAELYYNDYNVFLPTKRRAILDFLKEMKSEGIRIDGIGMQGHYLIDSPSIDKIEQGILDVNEAGFSVMFTELDVDVLPRPRQSEGADLNMNFSNSAKWDPYVDGLTSETEMKLALRYASLFSLFKKHRDKISRVTFWGINDGNTWLNNFPVKGRTNYPLLFDRDFKIKQEVFNEIKKASASE
jgi:endo-1,4-beta-xylanase